jgi:hypothetical protein
MALHHRHRVGFRFFYFSKFLGFIKTKSCRQKFYMRKGKLLKLRLVGFKQESLFSRRRKPHAFQKVYRKKRAMKKYLKNKNRPEREPGAPGEDIQNQHLPVDPLQDGALDEAQPGEDPGESAHTDTSKKTDPGTRPWPSGSWP